MASEVTTEYEDINPALAEFYLSKNASNRNVRRRQLDAFVRDMKAGKWIDNGDTIRFDKSGQLIDGQHRLMAIIESGKTLRFLVVRGLHHRAQETVDIGARRSFSDMLKLRGEAYHTALAATTRMHWILTNVPDPRLRKVQPTQQELMAHLHKNPGLRDAAKYAHFVSQELRVPGSAIGAVTYEAMKIDAEDATWFFERLRDGMKLEDGSAIATLRRFFVRYGQSDAKIQVEAFMAYVIKAWNAYREGIHIDNLRFNAGGAHPDKYPVMK